MGIRLTTEQKATQLAWLPTLKMGDAVLVSYDHSVEGQVAARVIKNDGAWITVHPNSQDDDASNFIKFCAVSGNGAYYGAIVPPAVQDEMIVEDQSPSTQRQHGGFRRGKC
jgi:hypothetical protein